MPNVTIYLTKETNKILKTKENKSQYIQDLIKADQPKFKRLGGEK